MAEILQLCLSGFPIMKNLFWYFLILKKGGELSGCIETMKGECSTRPSMGLSGIRTSHRLGIRPVQSAGINAL